MLSTSPHGKSGPAPALGQAITAALRGPAARVRRIEAGGQAAWLKQVEQLSLRWRIQKGDTRRAFEADRKGLKDLAARGLPVPAILAEGPDFFATAECGAPISTLLREPAEETAPFAAAGAALAQLHAAGVVHGRPKVRDICWDGSAARLIDFERYRSGEVSHTAMARDALVMLHSIVTIRPDGQGQLQAAFDAWCAGAPEPAVAALARLPGKLAWLHLLARAVLKIKPRSREMRAMPLVLDWVAAQLPR